MRFVFTREAEEFSPQATEFLEGLREDRAVERGVRRPGRPADTGWWGAY